MANFRSDAILTEILDEKETISSFLDTVFGFLKRNTDFYIERKGDEKCGFPKGMKEKIVYHIMQKYDRDDTEEIASSSDMHGEQPPPPAAKEVDVTLDDDKKIDDTPKPSTKEKDFSVGNYENGAKFDTYCWSQTLKDIEMHVKLPSGITSSKELDVTMLIDRFQVIRKINNEMILNGNLLGKVQHSDAVWTVDNGCLVVNVDKLGEDWWDKLFINEEPIDVNNIKCEKFIDEYPAATQQVIEKLRYDYMQLEKEQDDHSKVHRLILQ